MKKLLFLLIAVVFSTGIMAQTAVQKNQADIRKDANAVKTERHQRNRMIAHGKLRSASHKQHELNQDRKDMHADKKEMKIQGVKHPEADAKRP